jgi:hypothetical protein
VVAVTARPADASGAVAALLLTGTVGAGKTTTAAAVGRVLAERGVPHAVIDLDELRRAWPAPPGDPFQQELELENLRAVSAIYRQRGAQRLVLAGVLERAADRARYQDAVGAALTVCRLRVALPTARARLERRHAEDDDARRWHLHRSGELEAVLAASGVEDHLVDVDGLDAPAVARAVLRATGWDVTSR